MPPELQKELEAETERAVDDWIEQKHAHEVVVKECELCNGTGYFKSNTAEFEGPCPNGCEEE